MCEFKFEHVPSELIRVFPEYQKSSVEDKLLCLSNVESWIVGERDKIRKTSNTKEDSQNVNQQLKGSISLLTDTKFILHPGHWGKVECDSAN